MRAPCGVSDHWKASRRRTLVELKWWRPDPSSPDATASRIHFAAAGSCFSTSSHKVLVASVSSRAGTLFGGVNSGARDAVGTLRFFGLLIVFSWGEMFAL